MKHKLSIIFQSILCLGLILSSCNSNRFDVDVSDQNIDLQWLHLERDFNRLLTRTDFAQYNDSLRKVYGNFYTIYTSRVMRFGNVESPEYKSRVIQFLAHQDIHELFRSVDSIFHHIDSYKDGVETAFKYYNYYFPEKHIPTVVSMVTGLANNIVVTDSVLGVGLDLYLGSSSRMYELAGIPQYIRKVSCKDYMVYDMMRGWLLTEFGQGNKKDNLLSHIVNYGKVLYAMDAVFPFASDYYKIGFTADEIAWCEVNEKLVWSLMIENKQLYSTDMEVIRGLTGPGPFTQGYPKESPARVGYWIGWQIVREYMEKNPDISLAECMLEEDAQHILRKSKYKPK